MGGGLRERERGGEEDLGGWGRAGSEVELALAAAVGARSEATGDRRTTAGAGTKSAPVPSTTERYVRDV